MSPWSPEHASVTCHQSANTAGGSKGVLFLTRRRAFPRVASRAYLFRRGVTPDAHRQPPGPDVRTAIRFLLGLPVLLAVACTADAPRAAQDDPYRPTPYIHITHPEWSRSATLYELNTRQFTPEGTFAAAEAQLPRLRDLGVDIVWLMPIHPIGEVNRKGTLGSPYSVKDYREREPRVRNARRPAALRRHGARPGDARDPRLGGQPHRVGQPAREGAPRLVRARLEGRPHARRPGSTGATSSTSTTGSRGCAAT